MKKPPASLFRRTALTIAAGLLVFQIVSTAAILVYLLLPLAQRSADDLADLLTVSARVWYELPPERRPAFAVELSQNYGLSLSNSPDYSDTNTRFYPYIHFLQTALASRLPNQKPNLREDEHEHFHVSFDYRGQPFSFEFAKDRMTPRPRWALAWIVLSGVSATLILAWLLARRISAPVANLARAARRIAGAGQIKPLPETGDAEFVELARTFNETARQLQAQRENQTTLLAGVSHDLRTPLARMKMALGLLTEQDNSPLLQRMERDVAEMDELIGAQLELARAQEPEAAELTDIAAMLTDLVDAAEAQAPGRLRLRNSRHSCAAEVAPLSLRRCISNLLNNALRYGGGSDIQVVCRRIQWQLLIGVRDQGPGIPPELAEAVFRPFYRLESSRSRITGGSGLGLAITRQLCQTQGWHVAVKSRYRGGASIWLQICDR